MDISKVAFGLISLLVAVLVIGLVAVPVIEDSTTGTPYSGQIEIGDNQRYIGLDETPTFTLAISGDTMTVTNGDATEASTLAKNGENVLVSDSFIFRATEAAMRVIDFGSGTVVSLLYTSPISLAVESGSWTLTGTDTSNAEYSDTGTMDMALIMSSKGDWVHRTNNDGDIATKTTLDQPVFVGNIANNNTYYGPFRLSSFTDGVASSVIAPYTLSGSSIVSGTATTTTADYEELGGKQAVGVYYGFDWEAGENSGTYYEIWSPIDFESTSTTEGDTTTVLLALIPVLLFIAAIMIAVKLVRDA